MEYRVLHRLLASLAGLAVLACSQDTNAPQAAGRPQAAVQSISSEAQGQFVIAKSSTNDEVSTSLASDGTNFLVGYFPAPLGTTTGIAKARTVSATGVLGAPISTGRTSSFPPFVAFDGTNYLLVWRDITNAAQPNLRGQFVSTGGAKVGPIVKITGTSDVTLLAGLAFGGGQFLVTFNRSDGKMYRKFISPAGAVGSAKAVSSLSAQSYEFSNLATDGTDFLAVWRGGATGDYTMARLVRGDGTLGPEITVDNSSTTRSGDIPVAAFASGKYLVVWTDNATPVVYARLVTAGGAVSGGRITVAAAPARYNGVVVGSGSNFALQFVEGTGPSRKVKLRFIDGAGLLLGTEKTLFSATATISPLLGPMTANGSAFLLLINRAGQNSIDVYGAFKTLTP